MADVFGQIVLGNETEQAVIETLEAWFPVYLREIELQSPADPDPNNLPPDSLPMPRSFIPASKIDRSAADQLPAIIVLSPGLSGRNAPKQNGDGTFRVPWGISVGVIVSGQDRPSTSRLVRVYAGIVRTIMLQKQSLGGFADGTTWLDESYDDNFSFTDQQTIAAGSVIFEVWVDNVVNRYGGPDVYGGPSPAPDPATQPGSVWPEVEIVSTVIGTEVD